MHRCIFLLVVSIVWLLFPDTSIAQGNPDGIPEDALEATMVRVVDGDTIDVSIGGLTETVRLIGIDAPERGACFSNEATVELQRLIKPGRTIWLEQDVSERDRFSRLLAYVWLVRGSQNPEPELVNERLVRDGFARAAEYPPDTARSVELAAAMNEAISERAGFWEACNGQFPEPLPTSTPNLFVGDCSPFQSFEEAQIYYQQYPGAQPFIDPNWDGVACEDWFGRESQPSQPQQAPGPECHPSYPSVCIPPAPPDLDCGDIGFRRFTVLPPDPHGFDGDYDGIGCESG